MVELSLEHCIVGVALSFPIFDEELLNSWLLLLKSLYRNLLTVWKINTVEIFARLSFFVLRHTLVNRLSHFLDVEV